MNTTAMVKRGDIVVVDFAVAEMPKKVRPVLVVQADAYNRKMANTHYYLQDKNAMWVLRFTGKRGELDTGRNLTDQIARSFRAL